MVKFSPRLPPLMRFHRQMIYGTGVALVFATLRLPSPLILRRCTTASRVAAISRGPLPVLYFGRQPEGEALSYSVAGATVAVYD